MSTVRMKTDVKLPKKVKIGPINYNVAFPHVYEENDDAIGTHEGWMGRLRVGVIENNSFCAPEKIIETFMHEMLHGVDFVFCGFVLPEGVIDVLARGLLDAIISNKLIIKNVPQKMPKSLKIGPYRYKVLYPHNFDEASVDTNIMIDNSKLKIYISKTNYTNREYHDDYVRLNFMFGLLTIIRHNYMYENNVSDNGNGNDQYSVLEKYERIFSLGLCQVFCDNNIEGYIFDGFKCKRNS